VADFTKTAKGYSVEATIGHVTIVVDRTTHELVGAAMACPDASAAIHECVLAIKARVKVETLAETIHAFPSTSRILNGLFADALRELQG
jgi:pyruvate/2-oxoglutarate dehydrogenase complex dihydrolipoamide dehydrogenase (E3) component